MMNICANNRLEIEREFMALVINKPKVLDETLIIPQYLMEEQHRFILETCISSYKRNKMINQADILANKKINLDLYLELMNDVFFYKSENYKEQIILSEESIINYYKEDIIKSINAKLAKGEINYNKFVEEIKRLDNIKLKKAKSQSMITISDINFNQNEEQEYVKSNTIKLDNAIKGFIIGQLSVWSGGNASAKSTYLNQLAIETINQGYNVAIYSGELISQRLLKWITMQCAGKKNISYNNDQDYYYVSNDKRLKIYDWLNNKLFIYDNSCGNKAQEIIESIKESVKKNNVKVVILDNLMSMNLNSYGDNKYDMQSLLIQDLSNLAKELKIHIHFICHPRKVTNFLRKIDISGSADLTNIADNVFIMHRVNNDFKIKAKEMFNWKETNDIYQYSNVIEVCKNRELGVEDFFAGMYFEKESRRLLNEQNEIRKYNWEDK